MLLFDTPDKIVFLSPSFIVPGEISGFSVNPVYSNTSGNLTDVSLTWDEVNVRSVWISCS